MYDRYSKLFLLYSQYQKHVRVFIAAQAVEGRAVARLFEAYKPGRFRVRFPMMSLKLFIDVILPALGVDSASNRNDYQEYFLGDKGGRCVGLTTVKSGSLCTGIALPFLLLFIN